MENLYENWEDGTKVLVRFTDKSWEINVEKIEGMCIFDKGWYEFSVEAEIEVGDILVFFKATGGNPYIVMHVSLKGKRKLLTLIMVRANMLILYSNICNIETFQKLLCLYLLLK